jgi:hypothetical protein
MGEAMFQESGSPAVSATDDPDGVSDTRDQSAGKKRILVSNGEKISLCTILYFTPIGSLTTTKHLWSPSPWMILLGASQKK